MNRSEHLRWLMENGGPVIRYRTARHLGADVGKAELGRLRKNLLGCKHVRTWIDRLAPGELHGQRPTALENAANKLAELGLHKGMKPLDERARPLLGDLPDPEAVFFGAFFRMIAVSGLLRLGYARKALLDATLGRLDDVYPLAKTGSYDVYVPEGQLDDIPKSFAGRPVVRPELGLRLPYIHDVYAFANLPAEAVSPAVKKKIGAVVGYILTDEYQALDYGIVRAGRGRYYANGWSVNLPGWDGFDLSDRDAAVLLQRLELMAHFPTTVKHPWFARCLEHLEGYATDAGTYAFPRRYLKEQASGYYVNGAYMGLEETRRSKQVIEAESTLRMLLIREAAAA